MIRMKKWLNEPRTIQFFFFLILISLLIPVWQNKFFVTTDGPNHLYNSVVLNDWLSDEHLDFYSNFYDLNTELEPNWFTHAALTLLLFIFPAFLAEKILITLYIIGFAFGLKSLLKTINPKAEWLAILALPFVYQKIFYMGFFNCAISYVFYFFIIDYWLRNKKNFDWKNTLVLCSLLTITYFTHLIGLALSLITLATLFLFDILIEQKQPLKEKIKKGSLLFMSVAPASVLTVLYFLRSNQASRELTYSAKQLYHELIEGNFMFNLSWSEKGIGITFSLLIGLILAFAMYYKIRNRKIVLTDVFLLLAIALIVLYFNLPGYVAGGAFFVERMQFIIFIVLIFWLATAIYSDYLKPFAVLSSLMITAVLLSIQIPINYKASEFAEEVASVADHIEEESTVLALSFNHGGCQLNGDYITNHFWLFLHIGDYIGTEKAIVTLTNYEANTGYFPLIYKENKNPFHQMYNLESQPPSPNITNYFNNTDEEIDYIVLICYTEDHSKQPQVMEMMKTIKINYSLSFESANGRAVLFEENNNRLAPNNNFTFR